jgi:tuftelin-interacting protein 11
MDAGERARWTRHDSDNDKGSRRRKRRRDASTEPDLSKPVRFVSSGSVMPSRNPGPGPVSTTAKEDETKAGAEEVGVEPLPTMFGKIRQGARARREKKEGERAAPRRRR